MVEYRKYFLSFPYLITIFSSPGQTVSPDIHVLNLLRVIVLWWQADIRGMVLAGKMNASNLVPQMFTYLL